MADIKEVEGAGEKTKEAPGRERKNFLYSMLEDNVQSRLEQGKSSRYLAAKADFAYWLDPSPETADMAAEANLRVYRRTKKDKHLEAHLDYAAKPERRDKFREDVEKEVFENQPDGIMLKRASRLVLEDRSALSDIYYAVASARMFNELPDDPENFETQRYWLLSNAWDAIERALDKATEAEMPQLKYHGSVIRELLMDYKTHLKAKHLARDRESVMSRVCTEPVESVISDAEILAVQDDVHRGISYTCMAIANIRKFVETRDENALMMAKDYIYAAYRLGKEAEMPFIETHGTNIRRIIEEAEKQSEKK